MELLIHKLLGDAVWVWGKGVGVWVWVSGWFVWFVGVWVLGNGSLGTTRSVRNML